MTGKLGKSSGTIVSALRAEFDRKGADHSWLPKDMLQRVTLRQNSARGDLHEKIVVMALMQAYGLADLSAHNCFDTPFGRRFVDLYHAEGQVCFEIKAGRVTLSRFIRKQIRKDRYLLEQHPHVDGVLWCLFEGGSRQAMNALQTAGLRVLDFRGGSDAPYR